MKSKFVLSTVLSGLLVTFLLVPFSFASAACNEDIVTACREFHPTDQIQFAECLSRLGEPGCVDEKYTEVSNACADAYGSGNNQYTECMADGGTGVIIIGSDPGSPTEGTTNSDPGSPTEGTTNSDPGDRVTSSFKLRNPLNADSLSDLIQDVIRILIQIGLSISVLFIVYAGYLFVTAGGSSEKVTKAKEVFLWAVIGTAILLGALVIMEVIQNTIKQVTNKP